MLAASLPLGWLSPSSYERLRACPLQSAYARARPHAAPDSPSARLGSIAHRALELYVGDHPAADQREAALAEAWTSAVSEILPGELVWSDLPRSEVTRAKLSLVARRLDELLDGLPAGSSRLPECDLAAASDRIRGRADLVVRGPVRMILDHKTGSVVDEDGATKASYERQLLLYAWMEYETTGDWPDRLVLATFTGPFVEVEMDAEAAMSAGADALRRLDEYESRVPGQQPARPSPDACGWCPFAAECDAFWGAYADDWRPRLVAVRGEVAWVQRDESRLTFAIGSASEGAEIVVRGVGLDEHPGLTDVAVGEGIRVVGLRPDRGSDSYRPGAMVRIHLTSKGADGGSA